MASNRKLYRQSLAFYFYDNKYNIFITSTYFKIVSSGEKIAAFIFCKYLRKLFAALENYKNYIYVYTKIMIKQTALLQNLCITERKR